jgi:hypothetical protein
MASDHCPECGSKRPDGGPGDLCPKCLLKLGLDAESPGEHQDSTLTGATGASPAQGDRIGPG